MPELCRFFGIIIRMYREAGERHHDPHFDAYYQGESAIFRIDPIEFAGGKLPTRQRRLVEAWAEIIKKNSWPTGIDSGTVIRQFRLNH